MRANADIRVLGGAEDFGLFAVDLCAFHKRPLLQAAAVRRIAVEFALSGTELPLLRQF